MPYDGSQLNTFLTCPEKYRLTYEEKLRKREEDKWQQPKVFGQALHSGVEAYHMKLQTHPAFLALYPKALQEGELLYTPTNGLTVLDGYARWAALNWPTTEYEVKDLETTMIFPLGEGLDYLVKPDRVVHSKDTGYWAVDLKTTGKSLREDYWRGFENSDQITAQAAGVEAIYGQCSGVFIEVMKLGYRQRAYKGEPAGFHFHIERQLFNRTPAQTADWRLRRIRTIKRLEDTLKSGAWEKHEQMCTFCSFLELCVSTEDEGVKEVLYEKHDPYAYLSNEPNI